MYHHISSVALTEGPVDMLHWACLAPFSTQDWGGRRMPAQSPSSRTWLCAVLPWPSQSPPPAMRHHTCAGASSARYNLAVKRKGCGSLQEELLRHCGLASVGVTDDGKGAAPFYFPCHLLRSWRGGAAHCEAPSERRKAAKSRRASRVQAQKGCAADAEPSRRRQQGSACREGDQASGHRRCGEMHPASAKTKWIIS